ncbi:MAG: hypothetical protein K0B11_19135 [Mariniphaga sp.]|nr:hypothetical protein [Mariniphaga sp.]
MKKIYKTLRTTRVALVALLTGIFTLLLPELVIAQDCYCDATPSQDFVVSRVFLGDAFEIELPPGYECDPDDPKSVYIYAVLEPAGGGVTRYSLSICYELETTSYYLDGTTNVESSYYNNCLYNLSPIPVSVPIQLQEISWTCGDQLKLKNIFITAQTNGNSCSFSTFKTCYSNLEGFIVEAPLVVQFSAKQECLEGKSFQRVTYKSNSIGGTLPYTSYSWDLGDKTDYTIVSGGLYQSEVVVDYLSAGDTDVNFSVTDGNGISKISEDALITVESCFQFVPGTLTGQFECSDTEDIQNWLDNGGNTQYIGACEPVIWSHDPYTLKNGCSAFTGEAIVVFTATDYCGFQLTTNVDLIITDTEAPTGTAPTGVTGVDVCAANAQDDYPFDAADVAANYSDNCGGEVTVNLTNTSQTGDNCGWTLVYTYEVVDECGNKLEGETITHTGKDQTAPTITTKGNKTVDPEEGECGAYVAVSAKATDNCDQNLTPIGTRDDGAELDALFPVGTTTITWNVSDDCNNHAIPVIQTVTVNPIQICGTYNGTLFANTSVKKVGKKTEEVPAEIVVSIAISEDELACGTDEIEVSFKLEADAGGVSINSLGDVTYYYDSEIKIYIFSQKYSVALGSNYSTSITVTWEISGDEYTSEGCEENETLVTVSAPTDDFVTGGGYIILTEDAQGEYGGSAGTKNNFGFNVKWFNNFKRLKGSFNTIWRMDGRRFQARTNSASALIITEQIDGEGNLIGYRADIIYTNVNIIELCDDCTWGTGNGTVILTIYDWGEPGSNWVQTQPDQIGFAVLDNKQNLIHSTNLFDYNGNPDKIVLQYLDGGNIQVHAKPTNQENKSAEISTGSDLVLVNSELKVYPNPFSDKVVFEFVAAEDARARLEITNILGQRVAVLMDQHVQKGVLNRVEYEPVDVILQMLIYRLLLDDNIQTGRIIYKKE